MTRKQEIGATPVNIVSTLGLSNGSKYLLQNLEATLLFLHEGPSEPDPNSSTLGYQVIPQFERLGIKVATEGFWVWAPSGFGNLAVDIHG